MNEEEVIGLLGQPDFTDRLNSNTLVSHISIYYLPEADPLGRTGSRQQVFIVFDHDNKVFRWDVSTLLGNQGSGVPIWLRKLRNDVGW
jgi:hypothetical protein